MELKDLQKMTVKKLKVEALKHKKISGVTSMHKPELIAALAEVLGIDASDDASKAQVAEAKGKIKVNMKKFKDARDKALESKDSVSLKKARFHIKRLKRELRSVIA